MAINGRRIAARSRRRTAGIIQSGYGTSYGENYGLGSDDGDTGPGVRVTFSVER